MHAGAAELPAPQAIDTALPDAASMGGVSEQTFTAEATLRTLYEKALALLTD